MYSASQKHIPGQTFDNIFANYWPIFICFRPVWPTWVPNGHEVVLVVVVLFVVGVGVAIRFAIC